jgi:hypothetical protein
MSTPHSFGNEGVGLTEENIPYSKADRHKVCRLCKNVTHDDDNVVGHICGDLVCPRVQITNYPVDSRWRAYRESFPNLNWLKVPMSNPHSREAPAASSGNAPVQAPAAPSGINREEKLLLAIDEFITKNSPLTAEERESIVRSVSFDGIDPKQVRAILESVEKAVIISQKGYGLRKDGEARVKPPTAFERYYDTVKTMQSRKEAL